MSKNWSLSADDALEQVRVVLRVSALRQLTRGVTVPCIASVIPVTLSATSNFTRKCRSADWIGRRLRQKPIADDSPRDGGGHSVGRAYIGQKAVVHNVDDTRSGQLVTKQRCKNVHQGKTRVQHKDSGLIRVRHVSSLCGYRPARC